MNTRSLRYRTVKNRLRIWNSSDFKRVLKANGRRRIFRRFFDKIAQYFRRDFCRGAIPWTPRRFRSSYLLNSELARLESWPPDRVRVNESAWPLSDFAITVRVVFASNGLVLVYYARKFVCPPATRIPIGGGNGTAGNFQTDFPHTTIPAAPASNSTRFALSIIRTSKRRVLYRYNVVRDY